VLFLSYPEALSGTHMKSFSQPSEANATYHRSHSILHITSNSLFIKHLIFQGHKSIFIIILSNNHTYIVHNPDTVTGNQQHDIDNNTLITNNTRLNQQHTGNQQHTT